MDTNNDELLTILKEIKELLIPISACFEQEYLEIQKQKLGEKLQTFEDMLTPTRRKIFPLLFDPDTPSQVDIARKVNTSQPTVSRFVSMLLDQNLIEQVGREDGSVTYEDKYNLAKLL